MLQSTNNHPFPLITKLIDSKYSTHTDAILHNGQEAMLYKCGHTWLQRYTDKLDNVLLSAIGERIDHICLGLELS